MNMNDYIPGVCRLKLLIFHSNRGFYSGHSLEIQMNRVNSDPRPDCSWKVDDHYRPFYKFGSSFMVAR